MKNFTGFRFVLILCLISFSTCLRAQTLDSLLGKLEAGYPQEKLYLQYDKNAYNPGETIWFKAYLMASNMLSNISKNVYTELVDANGKQLQRKISPVLMSGAASSFDIPAGFTDSVVYIRAYTKWMLNFDSSFLYTRAIPIIPKANAAKKAAAPVTYTLQFFPEGGDLIEGLESSIAFKATDNRGYPIKVSGEIQDAKGVKTGSFSSQHDGMGFFALTAATAAGYSAVWKDPAGKPQKTALPAASPAGIVLSVVNNGPTGLTYSIKRQPNADPSLQALIVVAQQQQQMLYQARVNMSKTETVTASIPADNLPTGIVQLTIFNADNKPLAERISFINHQDYYFITDLNNPVKGLEKRAKNVIQVDVPDTLVCNLSIAVTDAGLNPAESGEDDIFSNIFLTSDLKGYIHKPAYYFSSEADSISRHLDLVMMTNGWRRFKWENLVAQNWPVLKYLPDDFITIEGNVSGLSKSELNQKELTGILNLKNSGQQILTIPVSNDGKFAVSGLLFYDTAKMFYQFNDDKNKILTSKAIIDIKSNFLLKGSSYQPDLSWAMRLPKFDTDVLSKNKDLAQRNILLADNKQKVKVLEGVTVTAKTKSRKDQMDELYSSGLFKGDGYTFVVEDDPSAAGAMTVLQYLQGKVAGLQISGSGTQMSMSWRGGTPSLFYNEMPSDIGMVQNMSMTDIAMIKVFRPPFFGAIGGGSGGAIAVYAKKGQANNRDDVQGLSSAKVPGYIPEKQFYSPDYAKYDESNSQPDFRTTLYWNPAVYTDKNSRRNFFTFYNNDVTKKIRVVIEGLNAEGKLTRSEKIY